MAHSRHFGWLLILALAVLAPLAHSADGDAEQGKATFDKYCFACHYTDKTEKKLGPGLKELFEKETLVNEKEVSDENVRAFIETGGNGMPTYEGMLSAGDMDNLLSYLKTL